MKKKTENKPVEPVVQNPAGNRRYSRFGRSVVISVAAVVLVVTGIVFVNPANGLALLRRTVPSTPLIEFNDLLNASPAKLAELDIAEMNMTCARGLPGAESLDISQGLAELDNLAKDIKKITEERYFVYLRNPGKFKYSANWWRSAMIVSYLNEIYKTSYDPVLKKTDKSIPLSPFNTSFFRKPGNIFIYGLITGDRHGTCSSIPVLVVALGRRLGYPLKLVKAQGHLFARWDDPKTGEKFNIEATDRYPESKSDEFYRNWPTPISDENLAKGFFLTSMTPAQELATFLAFRGLCLWEHGKYTDAEITFVHAHALEPGDRYYTVRIDLLLQTEYQQELNRQYAGGIMTP